MASPSSLSLLGFKQLSIYLVDCLKTPAVLRPAVRPDPEGVKPADIDDIHVRDKAEKSQQEARHHLCEHCGKSFSNSSNVFRHQRCHCKAKRDNPSVLMQKKLSVCLLDRMKAPGLNGPVVNVEEVDEQSDFENPQRMNQELEELQPSPGGADGTALATQKAAVQDSEVSESLGEASLRNSEEEETFCRDVVQREADAVPAAGEKNQQEGAAAVRRPRCEQLFTKRSSVFRHQRRHCKAKRGKQTKQETYLCHKCSTAFRTKRYFRLHVCIRIENSENLNGAEISEEAPRRERRHACDQCHKRFYSFQILQQHLLTHTGEKSYGCEVCGKQFGRKGTLKSHMLIHTGEKSYSCKVCGKQFAREGTLMSHMLIHTGEKPFTCEQCGKTCARRGDLNIHMLSHSEERPYGCSRCPKRFKQRTKLNQHERLHAGDEPYLCNFCPKQFRVRELLAAHLYTHSEERPFKCTVCPEAFDNGSDLKKHQMIHKPHSCSHCGKSFQLLQHLAGHECDHVGEKPYKGEKSCGELKALRVHQSIEKPAHCPRCRKTFVELAGHKCCEAPEKRHSCAQCGKRFSQAANLRKHQLVHTGEKPYGCTECGKQFNDKSNLSRHMRTHTDEKPFKCPACKKSFRLPHHLTCHRLTHGDTD